MPDKKQDVIRLDKDFRDLVNQNAEDAWREYCKQRGLDPDEDADEQMPTKD